MFSDLLNIDQAPGRPCCSSVAAGPGVYRTVSLLGVFLFIACGGQSQTTDELEGSGGGGTSSGGTGSGGIPGAAGGSENTSGSIALGEEGALPLLVSTGDSVGSFAVPEAESQAGHDVYALAVSAEVPLAILGTHLPHVNFGDQFATVDFFARADSETELAVSISPWGVEYSAALVQGIAWQGTRVAVNQEWQAFSVRIAEMTPLTNGEIAPLGTDEGSAVSLILEGPQNATVWVSRFTLAP